MEAMRYVKSMIDIQRRGAGVDFATCIRLAFDQMTAVFRNKILEVINAGDVAEREEGKPYWTGTKRRPHPVDFAVDDANKLPLEYLYAAANMYAFVFAVPFLRDRAAFEAQVRVFSWNSRTLFSHVIFFALTCAPLEVASAFFLCHLCCFGLCPAVNAVRFFFCESR